MPSWWRRGSSIPCPSGGTTSVSWSRRPPSRRRRPLPPKAKRGEGPGTADLLGRLCGQFRGPGHVPLLRLGEAPAGRDCFRGRGHPAHRHLRRGIRQLRQAIADHLYQFRGMTISPEQIVVGAGTEYLYGVLIQLLGRHRGYAVEDPGYQRLSKIYEKNDVAIHHIPMDQGGSSPKSWRRAGRRSSTSPPPTTSPRASSCR